MLKHATFLQGVPSCPPLGVAPADHDAFRIVYDDPANVKNYQTPAQKSPTRKFKDDIEKCACGALSLFVSESSILSFYAELKKSMTNIGKALGTQYDFIQVRQSDGLCSRPDTTGHFDLFEDASSNLSAKAQRRGAFP